MSAQVAETVIHRVIGEEPPSGPKVVQVSGWNLRFFYSWILFTFSHFWIVFFFFQNYTFCHTKLYSNDNSTLCDPPYYNCGYLFTNKVWIWASCLDKLLLLHTKFTFFRCVFCFVFFKFIVYCCCEFLVAFFPHILSLCKISEQNSTLSKKNTSIIWNFDALSSWFTSSSTRRSDCTRTVTSRTPWDRPSISSSFHSPRPYRKWIVLKFYFYPIWNWQAAKVDRSKLLKSVIITEHLKNQQWCQ